MNNALRMIATSVLAALPMLLWAGESDSQVPVTLTQQGRLFDAETGEPIDGELSVRVAIYDQAEDTAPAWFETVEITFVDGYFTVVLGRTETLDGIFDGTEKFVGIKIADDPEMTPRASLNSVPYALVAGALGDLAPGDVALADHTHGAGGGGSVDAYDSLTMAGHLDNDADTDLLTRIQSDVRYAANAHIHADGDISAYADLTAEGYLDNNGGTDLLTRTQLDARFAASTHSHGAADFNAYDDLSVSGRLDNNATTDLLTRSQLDGRFAALSHSHGAADIDAYDDLSVSNRLNNDTGTDLLTRTQLDARYLLSGDNARFYGCGSYVSSGALGYCPSPGSDGPNCDDVPAGAFCEADGECGLSTAPTAGCGVNSWYLKIGE